MLTKNSNCESSYKQNKMLRIAERMKNASNKTEAVRLAKILYSACLKKYQTKLLNFDGGEGSGNWGHEGRLGEWGGSKEGGGIHNRITTASGTYTSFYKKQAAAAKSHKTTAREIRSLSKDTTIIVKSTEQGKPDAKFYNMGDFWVSPTTDERVAADEEEQFFDGKEVKIYIPNSDSPNYSISKTNNTTNYNQRFEEAFSPTEAEDYDSEYRQQTGDIWQALSDDEKYSLYEYTGSTYAIINSNLRDSYTGDSDVNAHVANITRAIDRSELKNDTILYRGIGVEALTTMLDLSNDLTPENADSVIGMEGTDDGFMSTGSLKGKGFSDQDVQLEILAPKGTKAMYVEPVSACGSGYGLNWDSKNIYFDGKSKQHMYSKEMETLLQRGTGLKIVSGGWDSTNGQFIYKAVITGQNYE